MIQSAVCLYDVQGPSSCQNHAGQPLPALLPQEVESLQEAGRAGGWRKHQPFLQLLMPVSKYLLGHARQWHDRRKQERLKLLGGLLCYVDGCRGGSDQITCDTFQLYQTN